MRERLHRRDEDLHRRLTGAMELLPVSADAMFSRVEAAIASEAARARNSQPGEPDAPDGARRRRVETTRAAGRIVTAVLRSLMPGIVVDPVELAFAIAGRK